MDDLGGFFAGVFLAILAALTCAVCFNQGAGSVERDCAKGRAIYIGGEEYRCEKKGGGT